MMQVFESKKREREVSQGNVQYRGQWNCGIEDHAKFKAIIMYPHISS